MPCAEAVCKLRLLVPYFPPFVLTQLDHQGEMEKEGIRWIRWKTEMRDGLFVTSEEGKRIAVKQARRVCRLRSERCNAHIEPQVEVKMMSSGLLSSTDKPLQLPLREHLFLKCKEGEGGGGCRSTRYRTNIINLTMIGSDNTPSAWITSLVNEPRLSR